MKIKVSLTLEVLLICSNFLYARKGDEGVTQKPFALKLVSTIGGTKEAWITDAMDIAFLPQEDLIVSDKLEYCVKRFRGNGKLLSTTGKRGNGPSEFKGPGFIAINHDRCFVADFLSSKVLVFSLDLKYLFTFYAKGPVFTMKTGHDGSLWIGAYTGDMKRELFKYDSSGKLLYWLWLRNTTGDQFGDVFWLSVDSDSMVVISYAVQNKIEIWKEDGNFINEFSVPGVMYRPPYETTTISKGLPLSEQLKVPEGNLFCDCATDNNGYIYLNG